MEFGAGGAGVCYERRAFGGGAVAVAVFGVGDFAVFGLGVAEGEAAVVEALSEQDNVGQGVVYSKDDLLRVSKRTSGWILVSDFLP